VSTAILVLSLSLRVSRARAGLVPATLAVTWVLVWRSKQLAARPPVLGSVPGHVIQLICKFLPKWVGLSLATSLTWIESGKSAAAV